MTYHLIVPPALLESTKEAFGGMDIEVHASPYIPKENTAFIINLDEMFPRHNTLSMSRGQGKTTMLDGFRPYMTLHDEHLALGDVSQ